MTFSSLFSQSSRVLGEAHRCGLSGTKNTNNETYTLHKQNALCFQIVPFKTEYECVKHSHSRYCVMKESNYFVEGEDRSKMRRCAATRIRIQFGSTRNATTLAMFILTKMVKIGTSVDATL